MAIEQQEGEEIRRPASADNVDSPSSSSADPELENLRQILLSNYVRRVAELEAELEALERRVTNKDAFVAMVIPILGDAIRRKIRDSRAEMVEALYPIIGQTVVRAVSDAFRDLTRTIDAKMRSSFNLKAMGRRLQAWTSGVTRAEMIIRESLPFSVAEIFLIHRETGLLLWHISPDPDSAPDSDLISGMLTAIRDFVRESFGRGHGQLDEIQYGERRILIETAQQAYLAVVVDGIEPPGFRTEMRERLIEVGYAHAEVLRDYQGDPTPLAPVEAPLRSLTAVAEPTRLSSTQKRILVGLAGVAVVCFLATSLVGMWGWQLIRSTPTPLPVVVVPTSTPTLTPTPSPTQTATPTATSTPEPTSTPTPTFTLTPSPTSSPTSTSTPTATTTPTPTPVPLVGIMTGNVWLRQEPSAASLRLDIVLERGQPVEILAASGNWYRVRWSPQTEAEIIGWVPAEWVGSAIPIPERIITPSQGP